MSLPVFCRGLTWWDESKYSKTASTAFFKCMRVVLISAISHRFSSASDSDLLSWLEVREQHQGFPLNPLYHNSHNPGFRKPIWGFCLMLSTCNLSKIAIETWFCLKRHKNLCSWLSGSTECYNLLQTLWKPLEALTPDGQVITCIEAWMS